MPAIFARSGERPASTAVPGRTPVAVFFVIWGGRCHLLKDLERKTVLVGVETVHCMQHLYPSGYGVSGQPFMKLVGYRHFFQLLRFSHGPPTRIDSPIL